MTSHRPAIRRIRARLGAVLAAVAATLLSVAATIPCARAAAPGVRVLAKHLNQPKKLSFASDGSLLVALSGDGLAPASCKSGREASCADHSGAIADVAADGTISTVLGGLSSVSSGGTDAQATGPVEALLAGGTLQVLFQGSALDARTGKEVYGAAGSELAQLIGFTAAGQSLEADFGPYEAAHDPDHGAGSEIAYGESAINSDPYSVVSYEGGYAVADAGGNDVLLVSATGTVSVLAVLPTVRERAAAGTFGTSQKKAIEAQAQPVPDALAVGPDGALYVGELGGSPFGTGTSSVYRIVPGHTPSRYAGGLTAIADLTFDPKGRLLVLEIDRKGLRDPGFNTGAPSSGAIVRIGRNRAKTTLLSRGLSYPTGIAAAADGTIYVANHGVSSATTGSGGEILRVAP